LTGRGWTAGHLHGDARGKSQHDWCLDLGQAQKSSVLLANAHQRGGECGCVDPRCTRPPSRGSWLRSAAQSVRLAGDGRASPSDRAPPMNNNPSDYLLELLGLLAVCSPDLLALFHALCFLSFCGEQTMKLETAKSVAWLQ